MAQWQRVNGTDVVDVPPALDSMYEANLEWEKAKAPAKAKTPAKDN